MTTNYRSNAGREKLLSQMSTYLRTLANRRSSGEVTADDAHSYLTSRAGMSELMIRTRLSFINSVFSNGIFEQSGNTASSRPAAKGRTISTWSVA